MLRKQLIIILIFFFHNEAYNQSGLPPVYEIKTDTLINYTFPPEYYQVLIDESSQLSINQVKTTPVSEKFYYPSNSSIDIKAKTYWFKYKVRNTLDKPMSIGLDSYGDESWFYVIRSDGKQEEFYTGYRVKWQEKDGMKRDNIIPINIDPGEEITIYYKITSLHKGLRSNFKINLINNDNYLVDKYEELQYSVATNNVFNYVFSGFCLLAAIFNLFFFRIAREKVYLYFSLFLFTAFINFNPLLDIVIFRNLPVFWFYSGRIIGIFIHLFYIQFIRHYFQTFNYKPVWDKILLGFLFIYISYTLLVFQNNIYYLSNMISNIIFTSGSLVSIILFYRLKHSNTRSFAIATLPFALSFLIITLFDIFSESGVFIPEYVFNLLTYLILSSIAWAILFFTWVLFKEFERQRKAVAEAKLKIERIAKEKEIERRELIEQQKAQLEIKVQERTFELNKSLEHLKATQAQLIHSEKMASLGELTAGIAHEIQNPLNFVNNFSEVNSELIEELKSELATGNTQQAIAIADDIKDNEQKIIHHGKRADGIVKGMLQHSRNNSGQKVATDINALADEYLRLAYHGLRAKDNTFNASLITDYDTSIGEISIVPQDMGRVILNLITNAMYAVNERSKEIKASGSNSYEPSITVKTKKSGNTIQINIKDNGGGIPQQVIDKIFQPFFTTKPAGEGTGLGLSLSYDIVKAHGGVLKVNSEEGKGSEFIVELKP